MEYGGTANGGVGERVSRDGSPSGVTGSDHPPAVERPAPPRDQAQQRRADKTTTRPVLAGITLPDGAPAPPVRRSIRTSTPSTATHTMQRRTSLDEALRDLEAGTLSGVSRIVVSRTWWDALSGAERNDYQRRAVALGVGLSADDRISRHFVELVEPTDPGDTPPLSSERQV